MLYLATVSSPAIRQAMTAGMLGTMMTERQGYARGLFERVTWAADNECFSQGDRFDFDRFVAFLGSFSPAASARCLFATAPDVVGDAAATLERFDPDPIRAAGFPVAFVTQDGAADLPMPWGEFDVLFTGGSTAWKLSDAAAGLHAEARARGLRTHMDRVNTRRRIMLAARDGYDTVDGTGLAFAPDVNLPKLLRWMDGANRQATLFT